MFIGQLDGPPFPQDVQDALNDLPTISPLSVTVALVGTAYRVTFPVEMGDVPPLTVISVAFNQTQTSVEITRGSASNTKLALQLDGATTSYLNFRDDNITNSILTNEFLNLFTIRCPASLNNPQQTPSIVYAEEFESGNSYNNEVYDIREMAFCGKDSLRNSSQYLVFGNTFSADYLCFAYKISQGNSITMNFLIENDGNPPILENIPMNFKSDSRWHYQCIELRDMLETYSLTYLTVSTFIIHRINVSSFSPFSVMIDTVSLRNVLPIGYEDDLALNWTDRSSIGQCSFPFNYRGKTYSSCVLDENNDPICGFNGNIKYYCQNSSIEGLRRLFPKYQLLDNSLQINHLQFNQTIDFSFRYTQCQSPSLIKLQPSNVCFFISFEENIFFLCLDGSSQFNLQCIKIN